MVHQKLGETKPYCVAKPTEPGTGPADQQSGSDTGPTAQEYLLLPDAERGNLVFRVLFQALPGAGLAFDCPPTVTPARLVMATDTSARTTQRPGWSAMDSVMQGSMGLDCTLRNATEAERAAIKGEGTAQ